MFLLWSGFPATLRFLTCDIALYRLIALIAIAPRRHKNSCHALIYGWARVHCHYRKDIHPGEIPKCCRCWVTLDGREGMLLTEFGVKLYIKIWLSEIKRSIRGVTLSYNLHCCPLICHSHPCNPNAKPWIRPCLWLCSGLTKPAIPWGWQIGTSYGWE